MVKWHLRSKRSPTGKRLRRIRKKRKIDRGNEFLDTKIGKRNVKLKKSIGGNEKLKLLSVEKINVSDPKTKKHRRVKVLSVEKNSANPHFVRRNIITKGAVVKTDIGNVLITSRPGQDGIVNGTLLEEKK
ncbi:MAG: 30S ribosomal protein S8e [Candidatus Aenigmarchaeota archaeon]|nr:30S ribosomal protein S8e [Candidatus Aenigmarchaeota archaeon]